MLGGCGIADGSCVQSVRDYLRSPILSSFLRLPTSIIIYLSQSIYKGLLYSLLTVCTCSQRLEQLILWLSPAKPRSALASLCLQRRILSYNTTYCASIILRCCIADCDVHDQPLHKFVVSNSYSSLDCYASSTPSPFSFPLLKPLVRICHVGIKRSLSPREDYLRLGTLSPKISNINVVTCDLL